MTVKQSSNYAGGMVTTRGHYELKTGNISSLKILTIEIIQIGKISSVNIYFLLREKLNGDFLAKEIVIGQVLKIAANFLVLL